MTKPENYSFEEISEEWERFENGIMAFVTRCKSFFNKLISPKIEKIIQKHHGKSILYHLHILDSKECDDAIDNYDC